MKKKKETLMDAAKDTVKLGVVSGAGMVGVGALGALAGPAAGPVVGLTGAGLALANVGRMAKTGHTVATSMGDIAKTKPMKTKKKTPHNDVYKKLWG